MRKKTMKMKANEINSKGVNGSTLLKRLIAVCPVGIRVFEEGIALTVDSKICLFESIHNPLNKNMIGE